MRKIEMVAKLALAPTATLFRSRWPAPWIFAGILVLGPTAALPCVVSPAGSDGSGCGSGTSPCKTIQYAVLNCGPTIDVDPGTYFENVTIDRDVVINGSGPDSTTVDGGGSGTVFTIQPSFIPHNVELRGMSIVNGLAIDGGGIHNEGLLTVADSRVADNVAQGGPGDDGRGGGIFSSCGFNPTCSQTFSLYLIRTKIAGNRAKGGVGPLDPDCWSWDPPGRGIGGGIFSQGAAKLVRSSIIGNRAVGGDADPGGGTGGTGIGGGIYSAPDPGGPGPGLVWVVGNSLTPSRVAYNVAAAGTSSCSCSPGWSEGGGAYADGTINVHRGIFDSNSAARGGGISSDAYLSGRSHVLLRRARIVNNSAVNDGGGIYFPGCNTLTCTMSILHSTIDGNGGSRGGGIYTSGANSGSGRVNVYHSTLSNNKADHGGGIFMVNQNGGTKALRVWNSTLSGNSATGTSTGSFSGRGGAIHAVTGVGSINEVDLEYTTIAFNSATQGGAGVFAYSPQVPGSETIVRPKNSIIVDNTLEDCLFVGASELKAFPMNLDSDGTCFAYAGTNFYPPAGPLLVVDDPLGPYGGPTYTLRLKTGSPALDTAVGFCPGTDQRGMVRPAGPACDLGSFEVQ